MKKSNMNQRFFMQKLIDQINAMYGKEVIFFGADYIIKNKINASS